MMKEELSKRFQELINDELFRIYLEGCQNLETSDAVVVFSAGCFEVFRRVEFAEKMTSENVNNTKGVFSRL